MGVLFYLTSGLFLGWSLGANDASNVFGTAVGSRMIRFLTAAWICSVFVILGAVIGGAGAAHGLGKLGAVNAIAGSFTVAFSAALTVYWMTKAGLPVSTSQAIVGAIMAWNFFSGSLTDWTQLGKIVSTWVACPLLGAGFASVLYVVTAALIRRVKPHLLWQDWFTRWGLILAGAFASYSLGANNIGNVMGVFVDDSPFTTITVAGTLSMSGVQQLFLLGGLAIAVGVFTYSKRVMMTVGNDLMPLNPVGAWVVVVAHSLVLFLFSSKELQQSMVRLGLPPIPLIPVSSSQAVIGAVIGVGFVQAGGKALRQLDWIRVAKVASGWVATPLSACLVCYVLLFVVQNVFQDRVYRAVPCALSDAVLQHLESEGIDTRPLLTLKDEIFPNAVSFRHAIHQADSLAAAEESLVMSTAEVHRTRIDADTIASLDADYLSSEQIESVRQLAGRDFQHKWQLLAALEGNGDAWSERADLPENASHNKSLEAKRNYVIRKFRIDT